MALDRSLSALEFTALGIVLKQGPCNANTVVNQFAGSQSFAYRSGAGSIYPLLDRLAKAGLLSVAKRLYSITPEGVAALREWILPPFGPSDIYSNLDVLRSRAYFLKLLSPEEIQLFIDSALVELGRVLKGCLASLEDQRISGDKFGEFAILGAVRETEARIGWMNELSKGLLNR